MKANLTTGDFAELCGVDHRTVLRWIKQGRIQAFQLPGRGDHRIPRETCLAFLRQHGIPVPPELENHEPGPRRALVVEDDPRAALFLTSVLEEEGFVVEHATDGFRAGAMLAASRPHLLILDIMIPRLDGLEVLKFVRERPELRDVRVLVVSGASEEKLAEARERGADAVLAKPFPAERLLAEVERLVGPKPRESA